MIELFANNAESTIADVGGISNVAVAITLAAGEGARFPAAATGVSQFRAVLVDPATNGVLEYVTVTNRAGDVLTVTRESEDAARFPKAARALGTKVVDVITAAVLSLIGVPGGGAASQVLGKTSAADYALGWLSSAPTYQHKSGLYYRTVGYNAGGTSVLIQGTMYGNRFLVPESTPFDRILIGIASAGAAGSVVRLGIYSDVAGVPATLVADLGTVAGTATGTIALTIAQTLAPGWYTLVAVGQGAPATQPTIRTLAALGVGGQPGSNDFQFTPGGGFVSASVVAGALPAAFGTVSGSNVVPFLAMRAT